MEVAFRLFKMLNFLNVNKFTLRYFFLIKFRNLILENKYILICTSNKFNTHNLLNLKYMLMSKNLKSLNLTISYLRKLFIFRYFKFLSGLKILIFCNTDDEFFFVLNNLSDFKFLGFSFNYSFSSFCNIEILKSYLLKSKQFSMYFLFYFVYFKIVFLLCLFLVRVLNLFN